MAKMTETQRASYKAEAALGAALVADLRAQGAAEYEFHERHGDIYGAQTERLLGFHSEEDAVIQCVPLYDTARGLTTRTFSEIEYLGEFDGVELYECYVRSAEEDEELDRVEREDEEVMELLHA
jgi:hypothetical protein